MIKKDMSKYLIEPVRAIKPLTNEGQIKSNKLLTEVVPAQTELLTEDESDVAK